MDEFWVVWNPKGRSPQFRHESEDAATAEARRLAAANPCGLFYVLHAVSLSEYSNVSTTRLDGRLPF